MNIDERLEALTQSVELLASLHRDNEKRWASLHRDNERTLERLGLAAERAAKDDSRLENLVTQIAEGTARQLYVVQSHEQRISDLEENRAQ
jgi:hypothetical protein